MPRASVVVFMRDKRKKKNEMKERGEGGFLVLRLPITFNKVYVIRN